MNKYVLLITIINSFLITKLLSIENLNIAVSANFLSTINKIKIQFEKEKNCKIIISSDSTSNLYTKIINGAPYDIFISADSKHTKLLENKNIAEKSTIYAYGKIVLWIQNEKIKKTTILKNKFYNLSISNPKLSPYGKASTEITKNLILKNKNKTITGCNINQTFNFIKSKNSNIGFVALSQIKDNNIKNTHYWKMPKYMYKKITQTITILKNSKNKKTAKLFLEYINTKKNKKLISYYGYKTINE